MEFIRGLHNLKPRHRGGAVTIGNFDGVHLGHRELLVQLCAEARRLGVPTTVVTFEPHPAEFFAPEQAAPRLTRLREKLKALAGAPVDRVFCLRFDKALASLSAEEFVARILVKGLGVRYLLVGDDFHFGAERRGDFELLRKASAIYDFELNRMGSFLLNDERVSSTAIREALAGGDLEKATRWLGRRYSVLGRVAHGDKRGRTIGFPTANIHLHRVKVPLQGVFVVELHGIADRPWPGVANIGVRPTVDGNRALLEVHLFDFAGDIYGQHVEVEFLHKLRPEQRFENIDALRRQIQLDTESARAYFARAGG